MLSPTCLGRSATSLRSHMANWWTLLSGIRKLGTAYDTPSSIVICADVGAELPRDHDCAAMGCGSAHVVMRISKPGSEARSEGNSK